MIIGNGVIFLGSAISNNLANKESNLHLPLDLSLVIHEQRTALNSPVFFLEIQLDEKFTPDDNIWWNHLGQDIQFQEELKYQPHLVGVYPPIDNIDVHDESYDNLIKIYSIKTIKKSMDYANAIGADYFVYPLIQRTGYISPKMRMGDFLEESYRIYNGFAEYYRYRNFSFVPCIEILEYPKYPATPFEIEDILHMCQTILPCTRLSFNLSNIWFSYRNICDACPPGFNNIYEKTFIAVLEDTFKTLKDDDIYVFSLGGCTDDNKHDIPGIKTYENPFETEYILIHPDVFYEEGYEMNIARVLNLVQDFCKQNGQPLRLILKILKHNYKVVLRSLQEMKSALNRNS
jgi:hypothetical protein